MEPHDIYKDEVQYEGFSIFSRGVVSRSTVSLTRLLDPVSENILQAFAKDNEVQSITIISTSMGFQSTYTKQYKG